MRLPGPGFAGPSAEPLAWFADLEASRPPRLPNPSRPPRPPSHQLQEFWLKAKPRQQANTFQGFPFSLPRPLGGLPKPFAPPKTSKARHGLSPTSPCNYETSSQSSVSSLAIGPSILRKLMARARPKPKPCTCTVWTRPTGSWLESLRARPNLEIEGGKTNKETGAV